MYSQSSTNRLPLLLVIIVITSAIVLIRFNSPNGGFISRWPGAGTQAQSASGGIIGNVELVGDTQLIVPGTAALEAYNGQSALQEAVADNSVRYFRRDLPGGGTLAYFVVQLNETTHIEVVSADGATPGSDAKGDTIWTDGGRHLARVQQIATAPYAARDGLTLLGAMAFGFHGDARTSNEGSVVVNGTVHRVNAGRGTLCIRPDGRALIGLFDAEKIKSCQQAVGGGPVILWDNKVVSTSVAEPTEQFLPFNPINEDFIQLDWRKKIYDGTYPKTAIGVGTNDDGSSYLVMATSYGINGIDFASQLKALGCTTALGGDDDTSTQATWRGNPVQPGSPREVPDAVAVYVRP